MTANQYNEARLPQWAQRELARLRKDLDHAKGTLNEVFGGAPSNTAIMDYIDGNRALPNDARVRFTLPEGTVIDVGLRNGRLEVTGTDGLVQVQPLAANHLAVLSSRGFAR